MADTADERHPCPHCGVDTRFDPRAGGCLCGSMAHHTAEHGSAGTHARHTAAQFLRELNIALRAGYVSIEQARRIFPR